MLRISSAGVLRSYRTGLTRSYAQLAAATQTATDFLAFRNFGTNPAAASKSFQLIRSYGKTQNYIDNSKAVTKRLSSAWESAMTLSDSADKIDGTIGEAMNGDQDLASRKLQVSTIRGEMEAMVQNLNTKHVDTFVFAGVNAGEAPFTLDDEYNLYYQGINVDTGLDKDGNPVDTGLVEIPPQGLENLTDDDKAEFGKKTLEALANEKVYVDVGLGMKNNDGTTGSFASSNDINSASAVNVSMPGIQLIGYGKDANDKPLNAISQLRDICKELLQDPIDVDKISDMRNQFHDTCNVIREGISQLDTRVGFAKSNQETLTKTSDSLYEQISDLTTVDPAQAYMDLSYAQYYYNSTLKIGNGILGQSFIDYMN